MQLYITSWELAEHFINVSTTDSLQDYKMLGHPVQYLLMSKGSLPELALDAGGIPTFSDNN